MPVVKCPACNASYNLGKEYLSKTVRCRGCEKPFKVLPPEDEEVLEVVAKEPSRKKPPNDNPFSLGDDDASANDLDFNKPDTSNEGDVRREFQKKTWLAVLMLRVASVMFMLQAFAALPICLANLGLGIGLFFGFVSDSAFLISASYSLRYGRRMWHVILSALNLLGLGLICGAAFLLLLVLAFSQGLNVVFYPIIALCGVASIVNG
jgi:hypothetical protein